MKRSIISASALALAASLFASGTWAGITTPVYEDFGGSAIQSLNVTTNGLTWTTGTDDASAIVNEVLEVDAVTNSPLTAAIVSATATKINSAIDDDRAATFTADVSFTPSKELVVPGDTGSDLKFALYAYDNGTSTNLYVYNGAQVNTGIPVPDGTVRTVTINFTKYNGARAFTVSYNDTTKPDTGAYPFAHDDELAKIEFAGNGKVDNLGISYQLVDTTITWPTTMSVASYTADGVAGDALVASSGTATVSTEAGAAIVLTLTNADGVSKTVNGTAGTAINATGVTFGWADYLGAAVDGAYEIDNLAELKLFQLGVATNEASADASKLATVGLTFKLTADIALDAAWPGIGVQNGKDNYSTETFNGAAFQGTFDGQNHTISGFQMIGKGDNPEGLDYCGFFNSTYGATIQNLKIAYAGSLFAADTTADTHESGATFVGVAKNSTLRNLTTVAGTVSCSKGFGGIVGFLTSGTSVESCTNNVNMTSLAKNKCGGIAMIAQGGSAVTIRNCQNNGTQTTGSSNSEYGAIVGYVGLDITIENCETTVGRFLKHQGNTVTLLGVNKGDARVLAYDGTATPGLNFATVDGNVATFVADNALALNGSYKVMATGATATFEFAAAGTIAFDTALATPTYAITASEGLAVTPETVGTVTTYTASVSPTYAEHDDVNIGGNGGTPHDLTDTEAGYLNAISDGKTESQMQEIFARVDVPTFEKAALLNQDISTAAAAETAGSYSFGITKIKKSSGNVTVTVSLTRNGTIRGGINGTVVLQTCDTPNGTYADSAEQVITESTFNTSATTATADFTFTGVDKFFKVVIR